MQRKRKRYQPADTLGAPTTQTPDAAPDQPPLRQSGKGCFLRARVRSLVTAMAGPANEEGSGDRYECDDYTADDELRPAEAESVGPEDDVCPSDRGDDSNDCGLGNGRRCPDQSDECPRKLIPWSELEEQRLLAYKKENQSWRWICAQFQNRTRGAILTRWHMLRDKREQSRLANDIALINQSINIDY
jgi:hypothetical protein